MSVQNFLSQKIKNIIFTLLILLLIASNLATILNWRVHETMHNMLSQTISVFSTELAKKVLLSSPKVHLEIGVENRTKILSKNFQDQIQAMKIKEANLLKRIARNGLKAKTAIHLIEKRIQKNIARNLAALPSEGVPAVSLGVGVAVTAMDIYDACATMKDFNSVLVEMGEVVADQSVCGVNIPSSDQVMTMLSTHWNSSLDTIAKEAKQYNLPPITVQPPTLKAIKHITCDLLNMIC